MHTDSLHSMAASVPLYVRITPEQHAKLERVAKAKDRSVAWVVRSLVDRLTES